VFTGGTQALHRAIPAVRETEEQPVIGTPLFWKETVPELVFAVTPPA
jgi:hypothetical protein